jgi:hypothetical protein
MPAMQFAVVLTITFGLFLQLKGTLALPVPTDTPTTTTLVRIVAQQAAESQSLPWIQS